MTNPQASPVEQGLGQPERQAQLTIEQVAQELGARGLAEHATVIIESRHIDERTGKPLTDTLADAIQACPDILDTFDTFADTFAGKAKNPVSPELFAKRREVMVRFIGKRATGDNSDEALRKLGLSEAVIAAKKEASSHA